MTKITLEDFIKVYALTDRMNILHQFYHEHIELYRTFEENIHQQKVINRLSRKIQKLKERVRFIEDMEHQAMNNYIECLIKTNEVCNNINILIEIIKQQPTGNDDYILERLEGFINSFKELNEEDKGSDNNGS